MCPRDNKTNVAEVTEFLQVSPSFIFSLSAVQLEQKHNQIHNFNLSCNCAIEITGC